MLFFQDIFNIYSGTVSVSNMDLTTRIRKVTDSNNRKVTGVYYYTCADDVLTERFDPSAISHASV